MTERTETSPVAVASYGDPLDFSTFSGYAKSLCTALAEAGQLAGTINLKDIRLYDAFFGAYRIGPTFRPNISRTWLFSKKGHHTLMSRAISKCEGYSKILQIGSIVDLSAIVPHHSCLTDMTLVQAKKEGFFAVSNMSSNAMEEAIAQQKQVFQNAEKVFTLSDWTARSIADDYGVQSKKIVTVFAGSNLRPDNGEMRRDDYLNQILFVGIDWHRKGGPLLLEAFRLLKSHLPSAKLVIVGCAPAIKEEGVEVVGFLRKSDPKEFHRLKILYITSACFCLPSKFDPFPNVLIEASTFGLPSVAIDNGSRREAIRDGETGKLAREYNPHSLCEALKFVMEERSRNIDMGRAAKRHAERDFTWARVVEKISL